ncbi:MULTISPECIES: hypothetical protein [Rhodanobacter]|uniref:Uncharacterized protein n=1 Tax=Rhodanobacter hydrolyticus TaxID=2250595 RepID=A0ABW8J3A5_9GAMM|nr:hypothetical protein [Rhodanobacter sp. 7MK24]MBD8881025.1 hypothetical protein [Rhodanobacter sp. 7MK24]
MRLLSPAIAFFRAHQLTRQLREIERCVRALPQRSRTQLSVLTLREIGQAARSEFPHLYGTAPEARYLPWGQGTAAGYERARSDNPEVALRGVALWLAVAYHETKHSPQDRLLPQHRQVLQLLTELKRLHRPTVDPVKSWMSASASA